MPSQTHGLIQKTVTAHDVLNARIVWKKSDNPIFPYFVAFEGVNCQIRLNDFPEKSLYTLIVDNGDTLDLDDWPTRWKRP